MTIMANLKVDIAIIITLVISNDTTGHLSDALVITSVVEDNEVVVVPKDEFLYYLEHGCMLF